MASSSRADASRASSVRGLSLATQLSLLCVAAASAANPVDPTVVNGAAAFDAQGGVLTVHNSPNAIINWRGFSIGPGETTRFQQQGAASAVLNRVTGTDPSALLGQLSSNGRVFLVNPNGILVGHGARVDTQGFLASTLDIDNADFLAGRLRFAGEGGTLSNAGTIHGGAGDAYLIGPDVTNAGSIVSQGGSVVLAAGRKVEVTGPGLAGLRFEVQAPTDRALNLGSLEGGAVGLFAGTLRQSGDVRATTMTETGGRILLRASADASLGAGSRTEAGGTRGGEIRVDGERIAVLGDAAVDASGQLGGGTVRIGGEAAGARGEVPPARRVFVAPGAVVRADATVNGDGGSVVVWAEEVTRAHGAFSARGGAQGGDGGFVEVSAKAFLDFAGRADTSAPAGSAGTLLLDPSDLVIVASTGLQNLAGGDFVEYGSEVPPLFVFEDAAGPSTIAWSTIEQQLQNNNVVLTTTGTAGQAGRVAVQDGHVFVSNNSLSLYAHDDLEVSGVILNAGSGVIALRAGWDGDVLNPGVVQGTGTVFVAASGGIETQGTVEIRAGDAIAVSGFIDTPLGYRLEAGGTVTLQDTALFDLRYGNGTGLVLAGGDILLNGVVSNVGAGVIALRAGWDGDVLNPGVVQGTGTVFVAASGGIDVAGTVDIRAGDAINVAGFIDTPLGYRLDARGAVTLDNADPFVVRSGNGTGLVLAGGDIVLKGVVAGGATLQSSGGVVIDQPVSRTTFDAAGQAVRVTATGGGIDLRRGADAGTADARADSLVLEVAGDVGGDLRAVPRPFRTQVSQLGLDLGTSDSLAFLTSGEEGIVDTDITRLAGTRAGLGLSHRGNLSVSSPTAGTMSIDLGLPVAGSTLTVAAGGSLGEGGNLQVVADNLQLDGPVTGRTVSISPIIDALTLQPSRGIDLGSEGPTRLSLTAAEFARISARELQLFGSDLRVTAPVSNANLDIVQLGYRVTVDQPFTLTRPDSLLILNAHTVDLNAPVSAGSGGVFIGRNGGTTVPNGTGGFVRPDYLVGVAEGVAKPVTGALVLKQSELARIATTGPVYIGDEFNAGFQQESVQQNPIRFAGPVNLAGVTSQLRLTGGRVSQAPGASVAVNSLALNTYFGADLPEANAVGRLAAVATRDATAGPADIVFRSSAPGGLTVDRLATSGALNFATEGARANRGVTLTAAGPLAQTAAAPVTAGTLTLASAGAVNLAAAANPVSSLAVTAAGGAVAFRKSGATPLALTGLAGVAGDTTLSGAGPVTIGADIALPSARRLVREGGPLSLAAGRRLSGNGTVDVSGAGAPFAVEGILAPGGTGTIGTLSVQGGLSLAPAARLETEIGGPAAGQFDRLAVTGSAVLGGTLQASLIGGFVPAGQSFPVLSFGSRTGTFAATSLPAGFTHTFNAADLTLTHGGGLGSGMFWDNDSGDFLWTNPLNWSLDTRLPGALDAVSILAGAGSLVRLDSGIHTIASLALGPGKTLEILAGSLTVTGPFNAAGEVLLVGGRAPSLSLDGVSNLTTLTIGEGANVGGVGTVSVSRDLFLRGRLSGAGTLHLLPGSTGTVRALVGGRPVLDKRLVNQGTLNVSNQLTGTDGLAAGPRGLLENAASGRIVMVGTAIDVPIINNGVLDVSRAANFNPSRITAGMRGTGLTRVNSGVLMLTPVPGQTGGKEPFRNSNVLEIATGGGVRYFDDGPTGTLGAAANFVNTADGTIRGTGSLDILTPGGWLENAGTIAPGRAGGVGTLSVGGNLRNAPGGRLAVMLAPGAPGQAPQSSRLSVSGSADFTAGGTVQVAMINGYAPRVGARHEVLTATGRVLTGTPGAVGNPGAILPVIAPTGIQMYTEILPLPGVAPGRLSVGISGIAPSGTAGTAGSTEITQGQSVTGLDSLTGQGSSSGGSATSGSNLDVDLQGSPQ